MLRTTQLVSGSKMSCIMPGSCRVLQALQQRGHSQPCPAATSPARAHQHQRHQWRLLPRPAGRCLSVHALAAAGRGLPFCLTRVRRPLNFQPLLGRRSYGSSAGGADLQAVEVDMLVEGALANHSPKAVEQLSEQLEEDAAAVVALALRRRASREPQYRLPAMANMSLMLCDDARIRELNFQYRNKDVPTDVLSFEMSDELDRAVRLPVKLLGDLVISLDAAARQADERGYTLLDEARVLLVHGVLHLCGMDHELGPLQQAAMAEEEQAIMTAMRWTGSGLIAAAEKEGCTHDSDAGAPEAGSSSSSSSNSASTGRDVSADSEASSASERSTGVTSTSGKGSKHVAAYASFRSSAVGLVAIDMDGTLLDSNSRVLPSSATAIRAALKAGVRVVLATGKARPAAIQACKQAGLAGEHLLVAVNTPGVFLQGLAVHGRGGLQLSDAQLPADVVEQAFRYSQERNMPLVAFLGDHCAALRMTPELEELHWRYYEPLADIVPSLPELLAGPPVRKLLFMTDPAVVEAQLKPDWGAMLLPGSGAELMQAVDTMLEIVPAGVNKWAGLQILMQHLGVSPDALMAIGDGSNDLEMVANAAIGVAMGNAVPTVKAAASIVVASNDEHGVAAAFEQFVL